MSDAAWQRLPKARRAAVYRAVGRAARAAREDGNREVAADVRIAIDVLRSRARARRRATTARKPAARKRATRKRPARG
jgi:hypothetical protein